MYRGVFFFHNECSWKWRVYGINGCTWNLRGLIFFFFVECVNWWHKKLHSRVQRLSQIVVLVLIGTEIFNFSYQAKMLSNSILTLCYAKSHDLNLPNPIIPTIKPLDRIFYLFLTCMPIFMSIGCNLPFDL